MKVYGYIDMTGEKFYPSSIKLLEGFIFVSQNEPQEIRSKGRYKGQPCPFGGARLAIPISGLDSFFENKESSLMIQIANTIDIAKSANATDITIHFDIEFKNQCNLHFDSKWLIEIGRLGIPVSLSTYES